MAEISKESLEHLAKLARLDIPEEEERKLVGDLENILGHFSELQKIDTSAVEPVAGGTSLRNSFREDDERTATDQGKGVDSFPNSRKGFLRVPPVFKAK